MLYVEAKQSTTKTLNDMLTTCFRLNEFWGTKAVNAIIGSTCREYVKQAGSQSTARRDLQILKAAVNLYAREYGLDYTPQFTLPEKEEPRTEYMTRSDAARMLWNAYRHGPKHLVRYIIIGLYSGSRSDVITSMQWMPNTTGGYFDLDLGIMYRSAPGERETNKRKRPATIPNRLMFWLKRWHRQDVNQYGYIPHVVRYNGEAVKSVKKSWGRIRAMSGLSSKIVPHTMRHSSITWAMQDGVRMEVVSSFYSVTMEVLQDVYWHHHPDFQSEMKEVF